MERAMEALESQCHDNMKHAIETVEGLGIEYDEDVICDVCRSPDSEEGNDMVFCDKCNICVHQVDIMSTPYMLSRVTENDYTLSDKMVTFLIMTALQYSFQTL